MIEHVEDDKELLRSCCDMLKSRGLIYITVPAYSLLWSKEDVDAGHFRRYSISQIVSLVERAGFKVNFATYIFFFLPLPIAVLRSIPYALGFSKKTKINDEQLANNHQVRHSFFSNFLDFLLRFEIRLIRRNCRIPFGGSCLIVARKP